MKPFCSTAMIAVFLLFCINALKAQTNTQAEKLFDALIVKDLNNALILVQNIDDVNYVNENNLSLLMGASYMGLTELCKVLIDKGAKVDFQGINDKTSLMLASETGSIEIVKLLLDNEAKVDVLSKSYGTALMKASAGGYIDVVKVLLDKRAELDLQDTYGFTACTWASFKGQTEVIKLLLEKGANTELKSTQGKNAYDYAKNSEIKTLLASYQNNSGYNTLANETNTTKDDKEFLITTSYGIDTNGGSVVMKNGQWIPAEGTKITGQLSINIQFEGETKLFLTNITGFKMVNDKLSYLCENGESFYLLNGQTPQVVVDSKIETQVENLDMLIDEYRKNKSEKLVWEIWKIKSQR